MGIFQFFILYSCPGHPSTLHQKWWSPFNSLYCILDLLDINDKVLRERVFQFFILYSLKVTQLYTRAIKLLAFNSLYCIQLSVNSPLSLAPPLLSILYIVFQLELKLETFTDTIAFNSLYCILLKYHVYERIIDFTAFNSLYCILNVNFYLSFLILYSIFT